MITLHHLDDSRSFRIVWLLEELQLQYDLVCHARQPDHLAPDALRQVAALGKAPVILDDGTPLFESGAIIEYIIHRHGHGRLSVPCHHTDYAQYLVWLHAAEGSAMPALMPVIHASLNAAEATDAQRNANELVLRLCDDTLARHDYFAGNEFTAADIMMQTYLSICSRFAARAMARYQRLPHFLARVGAREAFLRATNVTDPSGPTRS